MLFPLDGAAYQVLYQFNSNLTVYRYYSYAHLQMKKLRHGEKFSLSHTANKLKSQDLNPGSVAPVYASNL